MKQEHPITGLIFSPDGKLLASASSAGTVGFFEVRAGGQSTQFSQQRPVVLRAFSPDGKLLATSSGTTVQVHAVASGAEVGRARIRCRLFREADLQMAVAGAFAEI